MWALTMMSSFTHQRSEASLTEREGPPQTLTKSFTSFPINYWHAVVSWKASQTFRWSVWWIFQLTNRLPDTLHQSNVWLERGRSSWPQSCTYACMCIYSYSVVVIFLFCFTNCLFTSIPSVPSVCHLLFWLQPAENTLYI